MNESLLEDRASEEAVKIFEKVRFRERHTSQHSRHLWKRRRVVIGISVGVAIVTLVINFFVLQPYYLSMTTILPETDRNKLASLGQLANLAEMAGLVAGAPSMTKLYPSVLMSESVLRSVISKDYQTLRYAKHVNLIDYFDISGDSGEERMEKMLKKLKSLTTINTDIKTGIVALSVEMPEPQLSADVANEFVLTMDNFIRHNQNTSASEQAKWVESRLDTVKEELRSRENDLKDFREQNRIIANSPALLLKQERLLREVEMKSAVLTELTKQYELAKIEEVKNISFVNVLDRAVPPVKKSSPNRICEHTSDVLYCRRGFDCDDFGFGNPTLCPKQMAQRIVRLLRANNRGLKDQR